MTLNDFKNWLYKERIAIDAISTTVKQNVASLLAFAAAIAIPAVPAIFSANGVYQLTSTWTEQWRTWAAVVMALAVEGAGMFLSILATKTYSAWRKKAATGKEVVAAVVAVGIYTAIVIALMIFSDVPGALKVILSFIPILGVAFYIGLGYETDLANRLDEQAAIRAERKAERARAEPKPKRTQQPKLDQLLETLHRQAGSGPFRQSDAQEWTGRGRTSVYALLSYGEQAGRIEQVSRGVYVYRNGKE